MVTNKHKVLRCEFTYRADTVSVFPKKKAPRSPKNSHQWLKASGYYSRLAPGGTRKDEFSGIQVLTEV